MTSTALEVVSRLERKKAKDRLNKLPLNIVEASVKVSGVTCTSLVQKQVSTSVLDWRNLIITSIRIGFCCSCQPVRAFYFWDISVIYSDSPTFLSWITDNVVHYVKRLMQQKK